MLRAMEPHDLYRVVWSIKERAVAGDLKAATLLLDYTVGKPGPASSDPASVGPVGVKVIVLNATDPGGVAIMGAARDVMDRDGRIAGP